MEKTPYHWGEIRHRDYFILSNYRLDYERWFSAGTIWTDTALVLLAARIAPCERAVSRSRETILLTFGIVKHSTTKSPSAPCGSKRTPAMPALQQILQPRIFCPTCSGSFTGSGGAKNQASVSLNTPSDWLTSTPGSRNWSFRKYMQGWFSTTSYFFSFTSIENWILNFNGTILIWCFCT